VSGVDFGKTARDYATHRAGFPESLFATAARHGVGLPGQRLLDLGTGTGTLARGFARRGAQVTALDRSRPLLDEAARLAAEEQLTITQVEATAEHTGLDAGSFEAVTAGQCWHWFDAERAAKEALRLLAPGGPLMLAYFDWIAVKDNLVDRTEALIQRHNPGWALRGMGGPQGAPLWMNQLRAVGFAELALFGFEVPVWYSHEAWRGRIRASAGVGASLAPDQIADFDAELAALLSADFPADPQPIPHLVFALLAHRPRA